jgi:hypothetical protein
MLGDNINPFDPKQYSNPIWMVVVVPLFLMAILLVILRDTVFNWKWYVYMCKGITRATIRLFKWWE